MLLWLLRARAAERMAEHIRCPVNRYLSADVEGSLATIGAGSGHGAWRGSPDSIIPGNAGGSISSWASVPAGSIKGGLVRRRIPAKIVFEVSVVYGSWLMLGLSPALFGAFGLKSEATPKWISWIALGGVLSECLYG